MRNELENIEKIERYLNGDLSADEKAAFEQQLTHDPQLREQVRLQREIMTGIERTAWKENIRRARARYYRGRFLKGGATGLGILILCTSLTWWMLSTRHPNPHASKDARFTPAGAIARPIPDAQTFLIDAARDTVIETSEGILLSIPAGAFLEQTGQPAKGVIQFLVRAALDPASIMRSGLSTRSGNQLLETGGMFSIDAMQDAKSLKLDSARGIYAEIPTDSVRPDMQLYTGNRHPDGTLDWVNPRPLEHDLVTVDITTLDFYPPGYLHWLQHDGYDSRNKQFTDSLYYSLAQFFTLKSDSGGTASPASAYVGRETDIPRDTTISPTPPPDRFTFSCGTNPAEIKAIWNEHFQHTLLATREFEQRMPWIHHTANPFILELYVDNLDKPLYVIDSLAARMLKGKTGSDFRERFLTFYRRHDGRVNTGSVQLKQLAAYYEEKVRVYTEAIARTEKEYWDKQAALDREADRKRAAHESDSIIRTTSNFTQEFTLNLKQACLQLGYDTSIAKLPPSPAVYRVSLKTTGWCNIDRAVFESTLARASMTVKDNNTGKTAHIDYAQVNFRIAQSAQYDRLYVYLLPDRLNSFMRITSTTNEFVEKLNTFMKYGLVCIAYKNDQAYYYYQQDISPGDHPQVAPTTIGKDDLDARLKSVASRTQSIALQSEQTWFRFDIADQPRRRQNERVRDLTLRLMQILFPCMFEGEAPLSPK